MGKKQTIIYTEYEDVPQNRQSGFNTVLIILGFVFPMIFRFLSIWVGVWISYVSLLFLPFLWYACYNILTGPIYYDKIGKDGKLKTWSKLNKYIAGLLLLLQVGSVIYVITMYV
jgi:hypothetical protein